MTPEGEAFANRMDAVTALLHHGVGFFPALAGGLDEKDWILIYAAAIRMAKDIRADHDNEAKNTGEEGNLRRLRASNPVTPASPTE